MSNKNVTESHLVTIVRYARDLRDVQLFVFVNVVAVIEFVVVGGQCLGKDGTQTKGGERDTASKIRRQATRGAKTGQRRRRGAARQRGAGRRRGDKRLEGGNEATRGRKVTGDMVTGRQGVE